MTETKMPEKKAAKQAVKLRRAVKAKKPKFRRHESWRYKRLKEKWRKPRGLDNKMRLKVKGWPRSANVGYGGPKIAQGLHPSGYREMLVHTPDEVVKVNPETHAIRIAHTVGTRKRIQIASLAREREIHILNPLITREIEEEKIEEEEIPLEEEVIPESEEEKEKEKPATKKKARGSKRAKQVKRKEVETNES
jgi:large subunit ribosomal protein L32e